jgi:mRNA-capping enzyme
MNCAPPVFPPHLQIPCRGRGQPPQPEAVNDLCWEIRSYMNRCPQGVALIHCTHGFNRTGYMVASLLARSLGWVIPKCLDVFRRAREPGIYKHFYIRWATGLRVCGDTGLLRGV